MKLALGTVQFGLDYGVANRTGKVHCSEVKGILQVAKDSGVTLIDTAMSYGDSESSLGACDISEFSIVTKLPAVPNEISDIEHWIRDQVLNSLQRLAIPSLYGLLLHRPDQLTGEQGLKIFRALEQIKLDGLVEKLGVSVYAPAELDMLIGVAPIDLVQAPINIIDQRMLWSGWLSRLKKLNIEFHARSIFLQGLLVTPYPSIPVKFKRWDYLWTKWDDWLGDKNSVSAAYACLNFVSQIQEVDRVVVGVDSLSQFQALVNYTANPTDLNYPCLECSDEQLLHPSNWVSL
jgi:aryl-alcohol dehydrogenase-like predicted oxidoreductase